ncbi:MAG: N-formylglutamate amidohydrolase [Myxococcota bacterium]
MTDAVEILEGEPDATVLLTSEHASNRLPPPWAWPDADRHLVDTHWAVDLGIAAVTRHLAAALGAPAALARFSRLLCDANRPFDADTLFRTHADGHPVRLNQALTDEERHRRIEATHAPYHAAIDAMLGRYPHAMVLSMHSFTPVYEGGPPRPMEIGVLFDRDEALAHLVHEALAREGWPVALNEPYSGRAGLIYAAERHAVSHGRPALELEIRQDLAQDEARHPALVAALRRALAHAGRGR